MKALIYDQGQHRQFPGLQTISLSSFNFPSKDTKGTTAKMIEGPVGDMVERNHARQDFKKPPYFADRRPEALETGGVVVALLCSDPRLDPRKIFVLDGTPGKLLRELALGLRRG